MDRMSPFEKLVLYMMAIVVAFLALELIVRIVANR
jgi:hypothetical protein